MQGDKIKIWMQEDFSAAGYRLFFYRDEGDVYHIYQPFDRDKKTYVLPKGALFPEDKREEYSVFLRSGEIKAITDEMQSRGFKSKDESRTEGELEAQTKHLKDMRSLVFGKDGVTTIPLPPAPVTVDLRPTRLLSGIDVNYDELKKRLINSGHGYNEGIVDLILRTVGVIE